VTRSQCTKRLASLVLIVAVLMGCDAIQGFGAEPQVCFAKHEPDGSGGIVTLTPDPSECPGLR
jgi:hypothetical protein